MSLFETLGEALNPNPLKECPIEHCPDCKGTGFYIDRVCCGKPGENGACCGKEISQKFECVTCEGSGFIDIKAEQGTEGKK
jgi:hypothetical protein